MKRRLFSLLLILCLLTGMGAYAEESAEQQTYALIVKDMSNPYMQYMAEGFENACTEIGAQSVVIGPGDANMIDQTSYARQLVERSVDAIVIAVNDSESISPTLQEALQNGIPVISIDSAAEPEDRMLHIQQASPEIIGRVLIQAAYEMLSGSGSVAIISTTRTTPNQSLWLSWMEAEMADYPEKYRDMTIVETLYGQDDYATSARVTRRLLDRYPDLDMIISPTVVGIKAAADVIAEEGTDVKVTGLGLPSDMAQYIRSGICPWMYLWNPIDMGYIAAYAAYALAQGTTDGTPGDMIDAGSFGQKLITRSTDGGSEIVVGNPYQFDTTNIAIWEDMF